MITFDMIALGVGVVLLRTVFSAASSDCRNVWQNCHNLITSNITKCDLRDFQLYCKRTCGLCGDCRDKYGIPKCRSHINANIHNCDKPIFQDNCNRTCGLCGGCQDTWVRSCWKEITDDINRCNQTYYQTICKKTCGVCGGCTDIRRNCRQYSDRCSEPWMKVSCRKTCRTCVDNVERRVEVKTAATVTWTTAQDVQDEGSFPSWIVYVITLLLLGFIGVLVFIIIRRRDARWKISDEQNTVSATATERFNVEASVNSDTPGGVTVTSSAANERFGTCDLFNSSAGLKSSDDKDDVNHGKNTPMDNNKSKSSEDNLPQGDVYTVGDSNDLHDCAGEITPVQMITPSPAGSASRAMEEHVRTTESENTNSIHDNEGNSLYTDVEEAGTSTTQTVTVPEEGLLYTELDFTQYRPEAQRPLPQQEETNYAAIEFKLRQ